MKKLLILSTFFIISSLSKAQSVILSENFESGTIPAGWTKTQDTPSVGWELGNALGSQYFVIPAHTNYAASNDDAYDNQNATQNKADKDFLITPVIDFTGHTTAILTFDAFFSGESGSVATIEATTDDGTTWTVLNTLTANGVWQSVSISLNSYLSISNLKIGFKHNDSGQWASGFAIDNVSIVEPSANDAELTSVAINSYLSTGNHPITGSITNRGSAPLTAIDISWNVNGAVVNTQHFSSLNIAMTQSFTFTHNTTLIIPTAGTYIVKTWVSSPNGGTDGNLLNDTLVYTAVGLSSIPEKKVVVEEVTGAWCGYCPDGAVKLKQILTTIPNSIGIAVHNGDGMSFAEGDALNTAYISGFPSGLIDRYKFADAATVENERELWLSRVNERMSTVVPVAVYATNTFDQVTRILSVNVSATFYGNFNGAGYRFNCFLLEDSCSGTGSDWNQANYYNTNAGHPMYGLGNPILGYQHMHVLRAMLGGTWGTATSIPANITDGSTYTHDYTYTLPSNMKPKDMKLVVLVENYDLNPNKREILNATEYDLDGFVGVNKINDESKLNYIFPNPISQNARVNFYLKETANVEMKIFNVIEEEVYSSRQGFMDKGEHQLTIDGNSLTRGIYFVKLNMGNSSVIKKITVIK